MKKLIFFIKYLRSTFPNKENIRRNLLKNSKNYLDF